MVNGELSGVAELMYETIGRGNSWIAPTDGSSDLRFVKSYLYSATPIINYQLELRDL